MLGIQNFLFGKKVKVTIPNLGIFEARVKKHTQKEITWTSEVISVYHHKEISLFLSGDTHQPYQKQIEDVQSMLKDEEKLKLQIFEEIIKDPKLQQKFKGQRKDDYRLACIYDWNTIGYELSYETENGGHINFTLQQQTITVIDVGTV